MKKNRPAATASRKRAKDARRAARRTSSEPTAPTRRRTAVMVDGELLVCSRCGRTAVDMADADRWNAVFDSGYVRGYICPEDQSPLDSLEAQVNDVDFVATVSMSDLDSRQCGELIVRTIQERTTRVIRGHADRAAAAGATTIEVDVPAWLDEIIDVRHPLFKGQSEALLDSARAVAIDEIREILPAGLAI